MDFFQEGVCIYERGQREQYLPFFFVGRPGDFRFFFREQTLHNLLAIVGVGSTITIAFTITAYIYYY